MRRWLSILLMISMFSGCSNGGNGTPDSGMDGDGTDGGENCQCATDGECPPYHQCVGCYCVPDMECQAEGDCPEGEQCYDRKCWPLAECDSSAECPESRFCNPFSFYCVRDKFCLNDTHCRFGTQCAGSQCVYFPLCDTDEDCLPGSRCQRHNCRPVPDCADDAECLESERCDLGNCQPITCQQDSDCRHDWRCFSGACLPRHRCDTAQNCPHGLPCSNRVCEDPAGCADPAGCLAGEVCYWGACVSLPAADCERDQDCPDGEVCDFGVCGETPACQLDDDCPEDQRCLNGVCKRYQRCDSQAPDTGCPRGYRCENRMCVFATDCSADENCIPAFSCREGQCHFSGACELDSDCPFGFTCESGACHDSKWCDAQNPCPDGENCLQHRCGPEKDCASDEDCSPGQFCSLVTGECRLIPVCPGTEPCQAEPDGPGPYPVGVITRTFTDTERERELVTEIWYPATEEARELPSVQVEMGAGLWTIDSGAHRDAAARTSIGPLPLIVYSHGGRGIRVQFVTYAVRMASHGYVVMAPDHPGDTFLDPSETDPVQLTTDRVSDVGVMILSADTLTAEAGGPLEGMIDTTRNGAAGLCHGGVTVLLAAYYIDRLSAVSPHAPSGVEYADPEHFQQVSIPVMLFGSEMDPDPTPDELLRAFSHLGGTPYLAEFLRAGHVHLSDICAWDPFNLEACGPHFIPQHIAKELAKFYNLAFFNRTLKDDVSMDSYLSADYAANIPEILYWPAQ